MLFDERPKETRQDLYDREEELEELKRIIGKPIIVLTGMRRIGKTSMLKVFLNECTLPYALVDVRSSIKSYRSLYTIFSDVLTQLNRRSVRGVLSNALKHVVGVSVLDVGISLSWDIRQRANLQSILDQVNKLGRVIIAIDEAQNFRGNLAEDITLLLAHCYDYCENITFILTGSEAGLLYDLLGIDDSSSPLYGRHIEEIRLKPFSKSMSIEFLKRGFSQYGMDVDEDLIIYAADRLDGVVGWLTELGSRAVRRGILSRELIDDVVEIAVKITVEELAHFSQSYLYVVEAIAKDYKNWSGIKEFLERKMKSVLYDSQLKRYLDSLEKRGYITKIKRGEYELLNPLLKNAFTKQ
jgi:AAA+ ATPase superfamily predicted ATPase